jgi:prepilin-type N-terminal cleavage/methylation domain-containing protein
MKKKSAFSLIELSVVVTVIGIIMLLIMKGSSLIQGSRLSAARSLSASSKINEINGMVAWYESSMKQSFKASEMVENASMTTWYNIASQYALSEGKNVLTRSSDSNVVYRASGINSLPSLQFSASGRFSLATLYQGKGNEYSVFAVLTPTLTVGTMTFIDSYVSGNTNSLSLKASALGISSGSSVDIATTFSQGKEYVVGAYMSSSGTAAFVNSVTAITGAGVAMNGFDGFTVGANKSGGSNFTGLISEILVFDRILSQRERIMVMSYLSKKYKIRVSGASY